jgi:hypothetical protein
MLVVMDDDVCLLKSDTAATTSLQQGCNQPHLFAQYKRQVPLPDALQVLIIHLMREREQAVGVVGDVLLSCTPTTAFAVRDPLALVKEVPEVRELWQGGWGRVWVWRCV